MNDAKKVVGFVLAAVAAAYSHAATLERDSAVRQADGSYEYTWLLKDVGANSRSIRVEFADVDHYVKAGIRPPGSLASTALSIKSDARKTRLHMRFAAQETEGKVGLLVDGQLQWVDLASASSSTAIVSTKQVAAVAGDEANKTMKIVGVKVTGRPLVGDTVGVDFIVLSKDRKDPVARTRISWLSGEERKLVGTGKSYLVHQNDRYQPLFALITPISKSGVRGRSTEVALAQVAQSAENVLPATAQPIPIIAPQRIWSVPVEAVVNGKAQVLMVTMNASEFLSQGDVERAVKQSFAGGVNTQSLRALVQQIDQLYASKKMSTFKALVPEQKFSEGQIQLVLMEPVVGNVSLSGHENEPYLEMVANRFGVKTGQQLKVEDIDEKVQIFNLRNRGKTRMLLEPGEGLGESDVHIEITPPPKAEVIANINNTGSEETGRQMRSVKGTMYGQIYGTEVVGLSRVDSKTLSVTAATLDVPLTHHDLVVGVGRTDVSNQPIDNPIDISSKSATTYFQLTRPWAISSNESVDFSMRSSHVSNGTSYLGEALKSNTTANKLMFGATYDVFLTNDWSRAKLTTGAQYTQIDTTTQNISNEVTDGRVGKMTVNALYQIDETSGWGGKAEFNAQPQRKLMPAADKFVIGMDNVRAYKPGTKTGDAGMSMSVDLYRATYFDIDESGTKVMTQPYVFYDNAVVYDGANGYAASRYKAAGVGIKMPFFAAYKGVSFDFYQARALSSVANQSSRNRFGFSLNYLY